MDGHGSIINIVNFFMTHPLGGGEPAAADNVETQPMANIMDVKPPLSPPQSTSPEIPAAKQRQMFHCKRRPKGPQESESPMVSLTA